MMIVIGVILVIAGLAFGIDVAAKNRFTVRDIEAFGSSLGLHHADQIFVLGAITGAVVILGLGMTVVGIGRNRAKHATYRRQRRDLAETDQRATDLDAENQRLRSTAERRPATTSETDGAAGDVPREERVAAGSRGGSTALGRDA